jgi:hypothetical protein
MLRRGGRFPVWELQHSLGGGKASAVLCVAAKAAPFQSKGKCNTTQRQMQYELGFRIT